MRILVCGGRNFTNKDFVFSILDSRESEISEILSGAARGVDAFALEWALNNEVPFIGVPAKWMTYGVGAGPTRNQRMLDYWQPDKIFAFPGGQGTRDMIARGGKIVEFFGW